ATCRLIEILKRVRVRGQKEEVRRGVSFLLDGVPATFTTPEIRVDCPDEKKFKVVEAISDAFTSKKVPVAAGLEVKNIITVDGVRVVFEHGWGLLRASNTQPVLVMRYEADSEENLSAIQSYMENVLKTVNS
ncbi:MAG: hypothetical protein PH343_03160, partial [Nitrospira sp.]|nr:hypothetical protein [Nitrospira sp.]